MVNAGLLANLQVWFGFHRNFVISNHNVIMITAVGDADSQLFSEEQR